MSSPSDLGKSSPQVGPFDTVSRRAAEWQREPQISEEEAAEWAALLLHQAEQEKGAAVVPGVPQELAGVALSADSGSSSGGEKGEEKRKAAASLQDGVAHSAESQITDTPSVNDTSPQRLILNVDSETLGRVQLVVDREEGGVRVTVGSDPESRSRLSAGKHTLSEALSSAGVRVNGLRIVHRDEVGTVLAQDLSSKRSTGAVPHVNHSVAEARNSSDATINHSHTEKRSRNLNLIG